MFLVFIINLLAVAVNVAVLAGDPTWPGMNIFFIVFNGAIALLYGVIVLKEGAYLD